MDATYEIILSGFEVGALRYVLSVALNGYVLDPPSAALARKIEIFGGQQGFDLELYFRRQQSISKDKVIACGDISFTTVCHIGCYHSCSKTEWRLSPAAAEAYASGKILRQRLRTSTCPVPQNA